MYEHEFEASLLFVYGIVCELSGVCVCVCLKLCYLLPIVMLHIY